MVRTALALFLAVLPAAADKQAPCANARTQRQMTACWAELANAAEKRVEAQFQQLRERVNALPNVGPALDKAQEQWRVYRDAHCQAVESVYEGGSMAPMQKASCRVRAANSRTAELQALGKDLAGLARQ